MSGRQTPAQRRPASRPRLGRDDDEDDEDERNERDVGRRVTHPVERVGRALPDRALENEEADRDRRDRRNQHRTGGDVLRQLRVRVEGRRRDVDHALDRRVQHLGNEDEGDREHEGDQLEPGDAGGDRAAEDENGREEVDAEVPLRAKDVDDPLERVVEAVDQRRGTAGGRRRGTTRRPLALLVLGVARQRRDGHPEYTASRASILGPWS